MNLVITIVPLIATLLSNCVGAAADDSKVEHLQQRALKVYFNMRESHAFSRHLVSEECMTSQAEIAQNLPGYPYYTEDDYIWGNDPIFRPTFCDVSKIESGYLETCEFDNIGPLIDSDACISLGGRVVKFDVLTNRDSAKIQYYNMPECLHTTCDATEYVEIMESKFSGEYYQVDSEDDEWKNWYPDVLSVTVSASGVQLLASGTSIISVGALVSLIAMLL